MTKVKLLKFTTDLNVITPAVEHPIQEWLNENKGISVVSITSSSRETMDGSTPVLAWDVTITYRPKMKLMSKVFGASNSAEEVVLFIQKWADKEGINVSNILQIDFDMYAVKVFYLVEDTDE